MTLRSSLLLALAFLLPAAPALAEARSNSRPDGYVSRQAALGRRALAQARPDGYVSRQAALGRRVLAQFEALATECHRARLYGDSDRMHFLVLRIDPDNRASRRALKFRRGRRRQWSQVPGWKPRQNRASNAPEELLQRVEQALLNYRSECLALIEEQRAELRLAGVERELASLLLLFPEDPVLHAAVGEVLFEERWVLAESATALKHRAAFPQLASACMSLSPEPTAADIRPEELALNIPWNASRQTPAVRVVGTTGLEEAKATSRASHAVGDYFRTVFAVDSRQRKDLTIYLLSFDLKQSFLSRWPDLKQETKRALQNADGGWLDDPERLAEWSANPARRIDGAVRQTLGTLFMDTYGITGRHGWAWEGIGLYMVHGLLGTRLTWFFDSAGYAPKGTSGLWNSLQNPEVDWIQVASGLLARKDAPYLGRLLGRGVNAMSEEDVLISYALASYLLEGFPQKTPGILRRVGKAEHPRRAFEDELGYSLERLEERLLRWLLETKPAIQKD